MFLLGTLLGCAEHFLISCIEMAYNHDALSQDTYLMLLKKLHLLGLPGIYLPQLFGILPYYWVPHSTGSHFWIDLSSYFLANIISWVLILAAVRHFGRRVLKQWPTKTKRRAGFRLR
jgi:hypothetical protein